MVILVDKGIFFWVSIDYGVIMDLDLDNIPCGTESLFGKPKSCKLEDDITRFAGLETLKINEFLLCIEYLGNIKVITSHLTIL